MGNDSISALMSALHLNSTLKKLDLSWNKITCNGILYISNTLKKNTSLINLNLSKNQIGSNGIKSIISAMDLNTSLTNIRLPETNPADLSALSDVLDLKSKLYRNKEKRKEILFEMRTSGKPFCEWKARDIIYWMDKKLAIQCANVQGFRTGADLLGWSNEDVIEKLDLDDEEQKLLMEEIRKLCLS